MHVVLIEPEIPQNTGSIARLCAGTATPLHLVGRLGFSLADRYLKRAGLDYWPHVLLQRHADVDAWLAAYPGARAWFFSARNGLPYEQVRYAPADHLVFGGESRGFPDAVRERFAGAFVRIPVLPAIRSLNLANAVGVALFEALRQTGGLDALRAAAAAAGEVGATT